MLQALRISNFAVIEESEVAFGRGLTVFTGETGAGKSILVDALGLLSGGRADGDVIRAGSEEAIVEGVFENSKELSHRLAELGLPDAEAEHVSVRRVVGRNGRGKAYVNGALVTVAVLAKLMKGLFDIAGQHENLSLFDPSHHRALLDRVGRLDEGLQAYQTAFAAVRALDSRMAELGGDEKQVKDRTDFLRFQLDELTQVAPERGEDLFLEEERRRLLAIDKLRRVASEAEALVSTQEGAALDLVGKMVSLLSDGARLDGGLGEALRLAESARQELDEAARTLTRYLSALEADPGRLAEVDERLDAIKRLCRKHGMPLSQLLLHQGKLAEELERLEGRKDEMETLLAQRRLAVERALLEAEKLSQARSLVAERFAGEVKEGLFALAMAKCEFSVKVESAATPEALGPFGVDQVEFFFSANVGEPQRPLAKVASGGEASRVLLALRQVLAGADGCQAYVLDEADAGVGGAVAEAVGRMMKDISQHRQVLCITHLPQVAAFADEHFLVEKRHRQGRTCSKVTALHEADARTRELARMMSGMEVSKEAFGAAQALVKSALKSVKKNTRPLAQDRRMKGLPDIAAVA